MRGVPVRGPPSARLQGLGPLFKIQVSIVNTGPKPLLNVPLLYTAGPIYKLSRSSTNLPLLVPGARLLGTAQPARVGLRTRPGGLPPRTGRSRRETRRAASAAQGWTTRMCLWLRAWTLQGAPTP